MLHIGSDTTLTPRARDLLRDNALEAVASSCRASEQQWPTRIWPAKFSLPRDIGDNFEASRLGVRRLIDMEIQIPSVALGQT